MSCLVTKLKGATGNESLPLLDELDITIPAEFIQTTAYIRLGSAVAQKVKVVIPDGVTIKNVDSDGYVPVAVTNIQQIITNTTGTSQTIRVLGASYLSVLGASYCCMNFTANTSLFKTGNLVALVLGSDGFNGTLTGDISNFGYNTNIEYLYYKATGITGTIESFVAKMVECGVTTHSVYISNNNNVTLNNEVFTTPSSNFSTNVINWKPNGENYDIYFENEYINTIDANGNIVS